MTKRFMISVAAAALLAGTGFANAQGMNPQAPAAQQSAPSGTTAPANKETSEPKGAPSGTKATQSEQKAQSDQKAPGGAMNQRAQDNPQGQKSKSMSSETNDTKGQRDMKAEGQDRNDKSGRDMKAEDRKGNMNAETNSERRSQTTGQAGAGAKLSTEQRTKITTVIREQHVRPATNINFSISIGTRVPRNVGFHALPVEIVTIYPEWRGYEFFLVNDQIVVVDPRTLEIVAVLEA